MTRREARLEAARRWQATHAWTIDALIAAALFVVGMLVRPEPDVFQGPLDALTIALLAVATGSLALRRIFPLGVWVVTLLAGVVALVHAEAPSVAVFPVFVSLFTVGTHTRSWMTLAASTTTIATYGAAAALVGQDSSVVWSVLGWSVTPAAVGVALRGQRAALEAAQARARQAEVSKEEEARRRVTEERLWIARELHDVVAHHIAVITVQAGVARHLLDVQPDQARAALNLVRGAGQTVLAEMSTILGLLRTSEDGTPTQPAPGLAQVSALVESMEKGGLRVTWHVSGEPYPLPAIGDVTAYRIVQESLTNAFKHGAGTAELTIAYQGGVAIDVINPVVTGESAVPVSGHGLMGMRERIALMGGQFHAERRANGSFAVHAEIPGRTP